MKSAAQQHGHHHAVQFYGDETSLFITVASFLAEGLADGQPAIVIATPDHRTAIMEHLYSEMVDCEEARRNGDLVLFDAEEMLSLFMVKGEPNALLFEHNAGGLIAQTLGGRRRTVVRAYGEMVDVLWKKRQSDAAIQLEMLWNKLALRYGFSLLCGYAMGNFYKRADQFAEVARQHTQVIPAAANVRSFRARPRTPR